MRQDDRRIDFQAWLDADPDHPKAYARRWSAPGARFNRCNIETAPPPTTPRPAHDLENAGSWCPRRLRPFAIGAFCGSCNSNQRSERKFKPRPANPHHHAGRTAPDNRAQRRAAVSVEVTDSERPN